MKKYFGIFILLNILSIGFSSCAKELEDDDYDEMDSLYVNQIIDTRDSTVSIYPSLIDEYVSTNYPNDTIEKVCITDENEYEVDLSNGLELLFDRDGNFLLIDDEDMDDEEKDEDDTLIDYPSSIDDYVSTNFPDRIIEEAELEDDGTYEVELDDGTELLFDMDGNFVELIEEDDEDEIVDYPTAIDDYLAINYPDLIIEEVDIDDEGNFEVELNDGTELLFDPLGNFIEVLIDEEDDEN